MQLLPFVDDESDDVFLFFSLKSMTDLLRNGSWWM